MLIYAFIAVTTQADTHDGGGSQGFTGSTVTGSALLSLGAAAVLAASLVSAARWLWADYPVWLAGGSQVALALWLGWTATNLGSNYAYAVPLWLWAVVLALTIAAIAALSPRVTGRAPATPQVQHEGHAA